MRTYIMRFSRVVAIALILSFGIATVPLPSRAAPVIVVVAAIAASTVVANVITCRVNIYWGCVGGGGGGGARGAANFGGGSTQNPTGANSDTGIGGIGFKAANVPSPSSAGSGNGGFSGSSVPQPCQSTGTNACGMHGNGFVGANGQCSATTPPDSQCPAPTIGSFYADPTLVDKGQSSTLHWSVTGASQCGIVGGLLNLTGLGVAGTASTNAIAGQTTFTLTCQNGGSPTGSAQTTVGLIPSYKEI